MNEQHPVADRAPAEKIVLIGMPGAGKTTIGQALAARRGLSFVDTDQLIEQHTAQPLQTLLDHLGFAQMRQFEESFVARCELPERAVVATGGSVVYGPVAMQRLKGWGTCVFLEISLETVKKRVRNWQSRGFSCAPGQTLESVYAERQPLYRSYADLRISCDDLSPEQVIQRLQMLV